MVWVAIESNNRQFSIMSDNPRRETCLLQNIILSKIVRDMESIQSHEIVAHGSLWLVDFLIKVSYSFLSGEKPYRLEDAVYQG